MKYTLQYKNQQKIKIYMYFKTGSDNLKIVECEIFHGFYGWLYTATELLGVLNLLTVKYIIFHLSSETMVN